MNTRPIYWQQLRRTVRGGAIVASFTLLSLIAVPQAMAQEQTGPQNPFRYVGDLHNEALDAFVSYVVTEFDGSAAMSGLAATGFVEDFACEALGGRACDSCLRDFVDYPFISATGPYNPWEGQPDLSPEIRRILPWVERISATFESATSLKQLGAELQQIEKEFLLERSLPHTPLGKALLASLAVSEASKDYWTIHLANPSSLWARVPGGTRQGTPWEIVKADGQGALIGFELGGVVGAVIVGTAYSLDAYFRD